MRRNSRFARAVSAAAAIVLLGAGPDVTTLRYADGQEPGTLVPYLVTVNGEARLAELSMAYLVRTDRAGRLRADLASEVPTVANGGISRDGLTITYRFRPGLRWSDGEPLTSSDAAFTVDTVRRTVPDTYPVLESIRRVDTPDPLTAVVHLASPSPDAVATLFSSRAGTCLLPRHLAPRVGDLRTSEFAGAPVGAGPYRVAAFRRGDRVTLEANPYFAGPAPRIQRVEYRFVPDTNARLVQIRTGELDLAFNIPIGLARRAATERSTAVETIPRDSLTALDLNVSSPLLSDVRVRRAIRVAVDRRLMFERVLHGEGTLQESLNVETDSAYEPIPLRSHDVAAANRLLDEAGFRMGPNGIRERSGTPLRLRFAHRPGPLVESVVELVRADLARVGIGIDARAYQVGALFASARDRGILKSGAYEIAMIGRNPIAGYSAARAWFGCKASWFHYCSRAVDAELDAMQHAVSPAELRARTQRLYRLVDDDVPSIALWQPATPVVHGRRLIGFHMSPFTTFDDIAEARLQPNGP